jgi:hypothetical protein
MMVTLKAKEGGTCGRRVRKYRIRKLIADETDGNVDEDAPWYVFEESDEEME